MSSSAVGIVRGENGGSEQKRRDEKNKEVVSERKNVCFKRGWTRHPPARLLSLPTPHSFFFVLEEISGARSLLIVVYGGWVGVETVVCLFLWRGKAFEKKKGGGRSGWCALVWCDTQGKTGGTQGWHKRRGQTKGDGAPRHATLSPAARSRPSPSRPPHHAPPKKRLGLLRKKKKGKGVRALFVSDSCVKKQVEKNQQAKKKKSRRKTATAVHQAWARAQGSAIEEKGGVGVLRERGKGMGWTS